jgi:hypothetical protein
MDVKQAAKFTRYLSRGQVPRQVNIYFGKQLINESGRKWFGFVNQDELLALYLEVTHESNNRHWNISIGALTKCQRALLSIDDPSDVPVVAWPWNGQCANFPDIVNALWVTASGAAELNLRTKG